MADTVGQRYAVHHSNTPSVLANPHPMPAANWLAVVLSHRSVIWI